MKTKIIIEIDTKFKPIRDEDDNDVTKDFEETFHKVMYNYFEEILTKGEYEGDIMDRLTEEDYYPSDISPDEFGDLGNVHIRIGDGE